MINEAKPRRKSNRLKEYDYSQPGAYFITICTKDRKHLFGEIRNGEMIENDFAAIVRGCWEDLPKHYPNIELDAFVVMPNHVHGIIMILNDDDDSVGARSPRPDMVQSGATKRRPYKPTLGNIVAYFKYRSTKRINEMRNTRGQSLWQRGYLPREINL